MQGQLLRLFVVLLTWNVCNGYPAGAGSQACKTLMPLHSGATAQTIAPPYTISVSANTYTAGDTITVTLDTPCNRAFKGFLIQARNAEDLESDPIGSFTTPTGTKALDATNCGTGSQSVTHDSRGDKNKIDLVWTAPSPSTVHIVFVATFVEDVATIFRKVYSPAVSWTGMTALAPSSVVFPTVHNCPIQVAGGSIAMDTECGKSKSCFVDCQGSTCSLIVSWKTVGDNIEVTLAAGVSGGDDQWIALGFSQDSTMGSDTVIDCAVSGTNTVVRHSRNDGKTNNFVVALNQTSVGLVNNVLSCSVTVPKTNNIFNPATKYTLLSAKGKTGTGTTNKIKHSDSPLISPEVADLTSNSQVIGAEAASVALTKAHGSLMITAWMFLASFGLVVARYYKQLGGSRRLCDVHIWFVLHRGSMITTFLLAVIAFILIFVDVQGYSQVGMSAGDQKFLRAHPILGIISTCLVVINPLMALCRPHPGTSTRPIFNWAHWAVGTAAWILSIVTIFIGLEIPKSAVHPYTVYVMAGFVAYQLLLELVLEVHGCLKQKSAKTEIPKSAVHPYTVYVMAGFVAYQLLLELVLEVHGCLKQKSAKTEIPKSAVHPYTVYVMAGFVAYQLLLELVLEVHGCLKQKSAKTEIPKSAVHPYTVYVMAGFVAYQLLLELVLEVHGCLKQKSAKTATGEYEMKNVNGKPSDQVQSGESSGAGVFRSVLLMAHGVILVAFLITLLYMVNAQ